MVTVSGIFILNMMRNDIVMIGVPGVDIDPATSTVDAVERVDPGMVYTRLGGRLPSVIT